jgi:hypothetical protein
MTEHRSLALLLGLALLGGCAQARPAGDGPGALGRPPGDQRSAALAASEAELRRQEHELGGAMAGAQGVDCARAFLLRDNICALAARICKLAGSDPTDASAPVRCEDARGRCQSARTRVAGPCPEAAKPGL